MLNRVENSRKRTKISFWIKQVMQVKSYLCIIPLLCKYSRAQTISAEQNLVHVSSNEPILRMYFRSSPFLAQLRPKSKRSQLRKTDYWNSIVKNHHLTFYFIFFTQKQQNNIINIKHVLTKLNLLKGYTTSHHLEM